MADAPLRFLIDNAISPGFADQIRSRGVDAIHVRDIGMAAADDLSILLRAAKEGRIAVSLDSDFSMLAAGHRMVRPSIIHFRTSRKGQRHLLPMLLANLAQIETDLSAGAIVVFEDSRIRVRRLPIQSDETSD